jgi:hypothetical protein
MTDHYAFVCAVVERLCESSLVCARVELDSAGAIWVKLSAYPKTGSEILSASRCLRGPDLYLRPLTLRLLVHLFQTMQGHIERHWRYQIDFHPIVDDGRPEVLRSPWARRRPWEG